MNLSSGGYAFGLGATQTCQFAQVVSHGGGLPGYGSQMRWLPEYGVGVVALANATYAGPGRAVNDALEAMAKTGALAPRVPQAGPELQKTKVTIDGLMNQWSDAGLKDIAAMNLLLDRSLEKRRREFGALHEKHGACRSESALEAEVRAVMEANPRAVEDYRAGKKQAIGALMADLTKRAPQANRKVANEVLRRLLG